MRNLTATCRLARGGSPLATALEVVERQGDGEGQRPRSRRPAPGRRSAGQKTKARQRRLPLDHGGDGDEGEAGKRRAIWRASRRVEIRRGRVEKYVSVEEEGPRPGWPDRPSLSRKAEWPEDGCSRFVMVSGLEKSCLR